MDAEERKIFRDRKWQTHTRLMNMINVIGKQACSHDFQQQFLLNKMADSLAKSARKQARVAVPVYKTIRKIVHVRRTVKKPKRKAPKKKRIVWKFADGKKSKWTHGKRPRNAKSCAVEHGGKAKGHCKCKGNVWYGYGNRWVRKHTKKGKACSNGAMGADPFYKKRKNCFCQARKARKGKKPKNKKKLVWKYADARKSKWTHGKRPKNAKSCAKEHGGKANGHCKCKGKVWYGYANRWVRKNTKKGKACSNGAMGADPFYKKGKACFCQKRGKKNKTVKTSKSKKGGKNKKQLKKVIKRQRKVIKKLRIKKARKGGNKSNELNPLQKNIDKLFKRNGRGLRSQVKPKARKMLRKGKKMLRKGKRIVRRVRKNKRAKKGKKAQRGGAKTNNLCEMYMKMVFRLYKKNKNLQRKNGF